jgi:hypothetical protein
MVINNVTCIYVTRQEKLYLIGGAYALLIIAGFMKQGRDIEMDLLEWISDTQSV